MAEWLYRTSDCDQSTLRFSKVHSQGLKDALSSQRLPSDKFFQGEGRAKLAS